MSRRDQPTPPFNSPYQQALKSTSLLQSPAYPSPARSDSEPSKYPPEGLGLYYPQPFSTSGASNSSIMFPPSPQPTEAWTHLSNATSPLIQEPIVDPWTSGAYDHPVSRSPIPWPQYQGSHRSSLSSQREMSVFSGDGSDHGLTQVKLEGSSEYFTDDDTSAPSTVTPNQLTTHGIFPYDHSYGSSPGPKFETADEPRYGTRGQISPRGRPGSSQSEGQSELTPRVRRRRQKTSPEDAKYVCDVCGRGFIRSYNKKSHMERHNPNREKEHKCHFLDCGQKFERKTDLDRHIKSVHTKVRDQKCVRCDAKFSRKDTLRRHEEDGCPRRHQLTNPSLLAQTRSMRTAPMAQQPYYPSPRPDLYVSAAVAARDGGVFDPRGSLFREDSFGGSTHGY